MAEVSQHTSGPLINRYVNWSRTHLNDSGYMLALSIIVGLLAGVAAWLLKLMIGSMTGAAQHAVGLTHLPWLIIIVPVVGVVATVLLSKCVVKEDTSNGVARIVKSLNTNQYIMGGRAIIGSLLGSTLTLGCGGTAGSEGPIAYAGAGLGSKLGQWLHVKSDFMPVLIGVGAGAGIAGIFKAPIGGALFVFEVLRTPMSTVAVLAVFLATITAGLTAYLLSGYTLDVDVIDVGAFDTSSIIWVVALGIVCGLYSLWYTSTGGAVKHLLTKRLSPWAGHVVSGLMLGVMIFIFPALYGEGYGFVTDVINGHAFDVSASPLDPLMGHLEGSWVIIIVCVGMILLKGAGSSAANNGGGVAGDFAPTLFAGCMLGAAMALLLNITGVAQLNVSHFALIAMAGSMAGIIRAPLMSMFLVTEMIGGFVFLWPVAVASLISYAMVMVCKRQTFYHSRSITEIESPQ